MLAPWLLTLLFGLLPAERADDPRQLVVLPGPISIESARSLPGLLDFYGDFGSLAVGEATPGQIRALRRRGLSVHALGPWPEGHQLVVQRAGHPAAAGAELLSTTSGAALWAVPEQAEQHTGCHQASVVRRVAARWARPFAPTRQTAQAALVADDRLTAMVAQVVQANLAASVSQLSSYTTRRADSQEILQAQTWLQGQLAAIPGLQVSTHLFDGALAPNVVAEKTGSVFPDRLVVLGAHFDSINISGSGQPAPGADDNASGSAGILEAARVLAQHDFENTIRIVWFSAEELGLIGSSAYAASLVTEGVQVLAMLNLDMIAYVKAGDTVDVDFPTNGTDAGLVQFCQDVATLYVPGLPTTTGILLAGTSDHQSFQVQGFPAAFLFEDIQDFTPFIHTSGDTFGPSANHFGLARDITRLLVATAGSIAGPLDMLLDHVALADTADAGGPYPLAVSATSLTPASVAGVQVFQRVDGGPWQATDLMPSVDPNVWVGSLPGVAPTGTVDYYLLATDSDGHQQWLPEALDAGGNFHTFLVGQSSTIFADDFEEPGDNGWTHAQLATQDDWQHDAPLGQSGDPSSAFSGTKVWGNDLGPAGWNGAYQPNISNYLLSPPVDCTGQTNVHLRFRRWLTVEDGQFDQAIVRVAGSQVWANPATPGGTSHLVDTAWTLQDLDVSALADGQPAVRTRFELLSDGGLQFGGWNLDDMSLVTVGPGLVNDLVASVLYLPAAAGGTIDFDLDAGPAFAGRTYVLAMSASGTVPGTPLGSTLIPLNFDILTQVGFQLLGNPLLPGFTGLLSPTGTASASLVSPPLPGLGLEGLPMFFAFFTWGPVNYASNPVTITYQP